MKTHCVDFRQGAILICNSKPIEGFWFFDKTFFIKTMNSKKHKDLCKNCIKKIQLWEKLWKGQND